MSSYYFAWVDEADTTFDPAFLREDESVLAFEIAQAEGDFATLTVELRNPRKGLLNPARKQWAWLSADFGTGGQPLFFGRLVAMPEEIVGNAVRLSFLARPVDFVERKATAAAALKVAPFWDPVWITPDQINDPDAVLESRSARWHIDRVSHAVTISDVLEAEDGVIDLGGTVLRDSIELSFGAAPATRISVVAKVGWEQVARGQFDLVPALLTAFQAAGTDETSVISSFTGQGLMEDWPKRGSRIGGGWSFGDSKIRRADGKTLPKDFETQIFTSSSGLWGQQAQWPCWKMIPTLKARYDVTRSRTEALRFTLVADAQAFVVDPDESEPLSLEVSSDLVGEPIDPGETLPIGSRRRRAYFTTARGRQSVDYLVAVARAATCAGALGGDQGRGSAFRGCRLLVSQGDPHRGRAAAGRRGRRQDHLLCAVDGR